MKQFAFLLIAIMLLAIAVPVFAQDRMTYEEYELELAKWKEREDAANGRIADLEAQKAALQSEIAALEQRHTSIWDAIYSMLSSSSNDVKGYDSELADFEARLKELSGLTPAQLSERMEDIEALEKELEALANKDEALLTTEQGKIDRLRAQLASARNRGESYTPPSRNYTVVYGDYLWKIAGMREHYGDPMKWMRIYSFNADQIKDPNLIFPEQRFTIPLAVDRKHYIVQKGDFLHSIAESVYGDPFRWREIYQANQSFLGEDASLIYPETILALPGR